MTTTAAAVVAMNSSSPTPPPGSQGTKNPRAAAPQSTPTIKRTAPKASTMIPMAAFMAPSTRRVPLLPLRP